jgi:hypothetical protein
MGIEGEEVQAKVIGNIFSKIIVEKFSNIEKEMPIHPEASRTPNRCDQNITSSQYIIVKTLATENKEKH